MPTKLNTRSPKKASSESPITWRPPKPIRQRFLDVVAASQRTKASVIHESVAEKLPVLEKRYGRQLKQLKSKVVAEVVA